MAFVLYEIWTIDTNDREELFDTAANLPEATRIAKTALSEETPQTIVYTENEYCDAIEVKRFKNS